MKIMIASDGTVGLAKGIIDDTRVIFYRLNLFVIQSIRSSF